MNIKIKQIFLKSGKNLQMETSEDNGCTQTGSGGWHSESYEDGSSCKWCGASRQQNTN